MSDEDQHENLESQTETAQGAEQDAVAELRDRVERLQKERDEWRDKYLRVLADFDNARKRFRADIAQRMQFANEQLVFELLPVLDNLQRALEIESASDPDALRSGVELTARMFGEVLARFGVAPIEPVGKPFDPARHEATGRIESDEHDEGIVLQEELKGYMLHDRVIRPSRVKVATQRKSERESVEPEDLSAAKASSDIEPEEAES